MSELRQHAGGGNGEPAPVARIVLEFPADRIDCMIRSEGVTPAHVYLGAWLLEALAREVRARVEAGLPGGLVVASGPVRLPRRND